MATSKTTTPGKPWHQLDLNLLRVLVALDRTRSVTAAGRQLSLSQPAASNALARLRTFFGDPLFVRGAAGLQPTPLALRLALAAARHLETLEREMMAPPAFDPATSTRTWRLSLSDLGEMVFLPAITAALLREAPHTRIVNAAVPAGEIDHALMRAEVDIAIGILEPRRRGVHSALLFTERYVALSDAALPRRQRTRAGLERAGVGLVVASPTATFHGGVETSLRRAGLGDRIVMSVRHFAAMPDLVCAGPPSRPLVGVVPSVYATMVCARAPLAAWALPWPMPSYEVRLLWSRAAGSDPAGAWLRERVLACCARPGLRP
jgi:DNA-binding transcriptional LysR family regulator